MKASAPARPGGSIARLLRSRPRSWGRYASDLLSKGESQTRDTDESAEREAAGVAELRTRGPDRPYTILQEGAISFPRSARILQYLNRPYDLLDAHPGALSPGDGLVEHPRGCRPDLSRMEGPSESAAP